MPSVDFASLKRVISIEQVLKLLEFSMVARTGDQIRGPCPIHKSSSAQSRSFSVNLRANTFQCFSCHAKGNQLDLWARANYLPIHTAAITLCERLGIEVPAKGRSHNSVAVGLEKRK
jgi:DNA primase